MKTCSRCKRSLLPGQFNFQSISTGKRKNQCKDCDQECSKASRARKGRMAYVCKNPSLEVRKAHPNFTPDGLSFEVDPELEEPRPDWMLRCSVCDEMQPDFKWTKGYPLTCDLCLLSGELLSELAYVG